LYNKYGTKNTKKIKKPEGEVLFSLLPLRPGDDLPDLLVLPDSVDPTARPFNPFRLKDSFLRYKYKKMSAPTSSPQRVVINGMTTTDATITLTPHEFYVVVQALKEIRETHSTVSYNGVSYDTTANIVLNKLKEKATSAITHPVVVPTPIPANERRFLTITPPAPIPVPVIVHTPIPAPIPSPTVATGLIDFRRYSDSERKAIPMENLMKVGAIFGSTSVYSHDKFNQNLWKITKITAKSITGVRMALELYRTPQTPAIIMASIPSGMTGEGGREITKEDFETGNYNAHRIVRYVAGPYYHESQGKLERSWRKESISQHYFFHYYYPLREDKLFIERNSINDY